MKKVISIFTAALFICGCFGISLAENIKTMPDEVNFDDPAVQIEVYDPLGTLYFNAANEYYIANALNFTVRVAIPEGIPLDKCFIQTAYDWWKPHFFTDLPFEDGCYVYTGNVDSYETTGYGMTDVQVYVNQEHNPSTQYPDLIINVYADEANLNTWLSDFDGTYWDYIDDETPTEPPATEPPATEPPTTEPPATEPPVTVNPGDCDCDGDVDAQDALLTLRAAMGLIMPTEQGFINADMDSDNVLTAADALTVLRIAMELI